MTDSVRAKRAQAIEAARIESAADAVVVAPNAEGIVAAADLLNATSDATLGVDKSGVIRMANPAAAELFGYPLDDLIGGSIDRLLPESVRARHRPLMEGFVSRPSVRPMGLGLPLAARRRDGRVFFADISLATVESSTCGSLALVVVRDASEQRRERLIAAQYLITEALFESKTLHAASAAVLAAVGPASGASVAALWDVGDQDAVTFVDSWYASEREQPFHTESIEATFPRGLGVLGHVAADSHVRWCSDVLAEPRFHRKDLARRLGLHAGVWIPFPEGDDHVLGVLELLFSAVRDPDPGMLRTLESFAKQLAQYLALRRSEADRQRVVSKIVQSVEDERSRIASDLHDDTVQVLVASMLTIDRLGKSIGPTNERSQELLTKVRGTLAAATDRTRRMIFDLRPQLLEAEGIMSALTEVAALVGREADLDVDLSPTSDRYDPAVEALLYRVMREAITNAGKHSRATHLRVSLEAHRGGVLGQVADDGVGFQLDAALKRAVEERSFGLSAVFELVRLAGGHVHIESAATGTQVSVWLPERLTASGAERTVAARAAGYAPPRPIAGGAGGHENRRDHRGPLSN